MNVHGYEVCRFGRIYEILVNVTFLHDIRVLIYSSVGLTICFVGVSPMVHLNQRRSWTSYPFCCLNITFYDYGEYVLRLD
jgi:hypothetical protein